MYLLDRGAFLRYLLDRGNRGFVLLLVADSSCRVSSTEPVSSGLKSQILIVTFA